MKNIFEKIREEHNEYQISFENYTDSGYISDSKKTVFLNKSITDNLTEDEINFLVIFFIKQDSYNDVFTNILNSDISFCKYLTQKGIDIIYYINFLKKISRIVEVQKKVFIEKRIQDMISVESIRKQIRKEKLFNILRK